MNHDDEEEEHNYQSSKERRREPALRVSIEIKKMNIKHRTMREGRRERYLIDRS